MTGLDEFAAFMTYWTLKSIGDLHYSEFPASSVSSTPMTLSSLTLHYKECSWMKLTTAKMASYSRKKWEIQTTWTLKPSFSAIALCSSNVVRTKQLKII